LICDALLCEGFERVQSLEEDLQSAHDALRAADHLVIIFPLWLGTLPAILKGFLERVLQSDLVEPARHGRFVKIFRGKSARIIVTMGMPGFIYRWWFGAHAVKMLKRNILGFVGARPIRSTIYGKCRKSRGGTAPGVAPGGRSLGAERGLKVRMREDEGCGHMV
jgi:NAD(P)H dehydrogenase (quinone)